jgi:Xaa-Pro dipeptidase
VALVARGRDPELLVRLLERGNVTEYSWLDRASTWKEGDDMAEVTLRCVRALGQHKTVGLEKQAGS